MLALHHDGRTADALAVYARTWENLADELGLDPTPALQGLHQTILRGEPIHPRTRKRLERNCPRLAECSHGSWVFHCSVEPVAL
jgi:DNA-binding SARP family transcriptional activator